MSLRFFAAVVGCMFACVSPFASAQAPLMPYQEYSKRIKAAEMVGPLRSDLFGDSVSLSNGTAEFVVTDIDLAGNSSLPVRLGRRFRVASRAEPGGGGIGGLENWDLDVPYLTSYNWTENSSTTPNRCSQMWRPYVPTGFELEDFWHGSQMYMPGQGSQELLWIGHAPPNTPAYPMPSSGGPYYWGTRNQYRISCLSSTFNGFPGEGFLAVDTQGTKYYFDVGFDVDVGAIYKRVFTTFENLTPHYRRKTYLLLRRVEDRHQNWVNYNWAGSTLESITANDGRSITLVRVSPTVLRADTTAVSGTRSWTYEFGVGGLEKVTRPDGSKWQYSYNGTLTPVYTSTDYDTAGPDCQQPLEAPDSFRLVATHPSGAVGTFDFAHIRHKRSGIPTDVCQWAYRDLTTGRDIYKMAIPEYFDVYSIVQKQLAGPGAPTAIWGYDYEMPLESRTGAVLPGSACTGSRTTKVFQPDGGRIDYVFGAIHSCNDGRLLETSTYDAQGRKLRSESHQYMTRAEAAQQPFPEFAGGVALSGDDPVAVWNLPQVSTVIAQGPDIESLPYDSFTSQITAFDVFARPTSTTKSSSLGYSKVETVDYYDHLSSWTVGQILRSRVDGIEAGRVEFNATNALPERTYTFGRLRQTLSYNSDGTLATVSDARDGIAGLDTTITLSNWKLGIPQLITYPVTTESPSGATRSAVVNDDGTLASVTDENGYKTCYTFDPLGRLTGITYPSESALAVCDTSAWAATILSFAQIDSAEYGIGPGHWKQTVSTGNARKVSYFDAFWRPLVVESFDNANPSTTRSVTVTRYDANGRQVFNSYPRSGLADYSDAGLTGSHSSYDALDRVTEVVQDSELGALRSKTEYLAGLKVRTTNPRNFATTISYLAYDQPTLEWPLAIMHPEGAYTTITRDVFGKPHSLKRSDANESIVLTRSYGYDAYQRLCRTEEPETGTTLLGYDGADNPAWSASGLAAGTPCDEAGNTAQILARKVVRTHDARNRIGSLTFPDGRGNQTWVYTPDGLPAQISTYNEVASGGSVVNAYTYNRRRLLTGEAISQPGLYSWGIGYGYNGSGQLASHQYPDGLLVTYGLNALGQPTSVQSSAGQTFADMVSYHSNGAMRQFTYGNGIVHTLTQNDRGLPDVSEDAYGATAYLSDGYDFDANGNVAAITDGATGRGQRGNRAMSYDGLDRLVSTISPMYSASSSNTASYAYDVLDNLTRLVAPGRDHFYCYDANWRLTNVKTGSCAGTSVVGLGYDVQGNLENKNGQGFQFDFGNRLREATGKENYRYDGYGRRVHTLRPAHDNSYSFYGQDGVLRYQEDYRQGKASRYIYLNGSLIARVGSATNALMPPTISGPANDSDGTYTVTWSSVANASLYRLEESVGTGAWIEIASSSGLSSAVTGKPSGSYRYRVRACRMACSAYSLMATVAVEHVPAGVPTLTAPGYDTDGAYTVQWTSVSLATRYELEEQVGAGAWTQIHNASPLSKAITGKASGNYGYRVRACNSSGCAAWSAVATVAVQLPPPGPPSLTVPAQGLGGSYNIIWTGVSGATSYSLEETANAGASWTVAYTGSAQSLAVASKAAGNYGYRIKACNPAGCSAYSSTGNVSVIYAPGGSPVLSAPAQATNGTYTVSWSTVSGATRYELDESTGGGAWSLVQNSAATSKAYSGKGGGSYSYRVRACNDAGCGPASAAVNVQSIYAPGAAPSLSAPAQNNSGAYTVSWTQVSSATQYRVEESTNGGAWLEIQNSAASSVTLTGKGNGSFGYRARACNLAGCGGYSNTVTVSVVLPPATPQIQTAHKHVTIQGPIVTQTCSVQWSSVAAATSYNLMVYQGNVVYSGADTFVMSGPYSAQYCGPSFVVQACNSAGCSAWSSPPYQQTYSEETIPEGDPL